MRSLGLYPGLAQPFQMRVDTVRHPFAIPQLNTGQNAVSDHVPSVVNIGIIVFGVGGRMQVLQAGDRRRSEAASG